MDLDVGEAAPADFIASAAFDGARRGFVFRTGEHGIGYYCDGQATKKAQQQPAQAQHSIRPVMPPPPPRPRPPPPDPPPAPPAAALPPATGFWQQLEDFEQELDGAGGAGTSSSLIPEPIPAQHGLPRAPSPPARLPLPGFTEVIRWRPRRRRHQQRTAPYKWPTAPRATLVAQQAQAQTQVRGQSRAPGEVQVPLPDVNAMLMEWTEGTRPGSAEWVQALRDRGAPQPQWWSTGLHFDNIG